MIKNLLHKQEQADSEADIKNDVCDVKNCVIHDFLRVIFDLLFDLLFAFYLILQFGLLSVFLFVLFVLLFDLLLKFICFFV